MPETPQHPADNDAPGCELEVCRAGAIRAGENPDTVSCYLCRTTPIPPVESVSQYQDDQGNWRQK